MLVFWPGLYLYIIMRTVGSFSFVSYEKVIYGVTQVSVGTARS